MTLKINVHRYSDKDERVLSLEKTRKEQDKANKGNFVGDYIFFV